MDGQLRRRSWVARVGIGVAALALALAIVGRYREECATERTVDRLLAAESTATREAGAGTLADAPAPVRRYLETALPEPSAPASGGWVRIEQEGTLRTGDADSPWRAFTATHRATVRQPGFVWDARVGLLPLVWLRVRDAFVDGAGSARLSLWSAVPVGGSASTPALDEAALQRYLAEAVWYPAALHPSNGVRWEPLDDRTARATVTAGETTASLTFHFDGDGRVERVHTSGRYRAVDGGFEPTPWTGVWRGYEERDGVEVPTRGEVVWHLPGGDLRAWRGRVTGFERRER
jgi:hypothetical protein